ncbi:hypothetical protein AGDE_02538 [Angomonas deanei]|nr:hypothetical protein AGDE_02538 [Angomonas deanei]|eukprot:EPY41386.1 hypothetical protein AGDE_02538 [Angomonas deanei]
MNTVRLNQSSIGQYFGVSEMCINNSHYKASTDATATDTNVSNFSEMSIPLEEGGRVSGNQSLNISFNKLPQLSSAESTWKSRYLPCYAALALSLSDLLMVAMNGEELLECLMGLLLEVEVAYAGGTATRAIAQRTLKQFRHGMSDSLKQQMYTVSNRGTVMADDYQYGAARDNNPSFTSPAANVGRTEAGGGSPLVKDGKADAKEKDSSDGESVKFIFLSTQHLRYQSGSPSYDVVVPSLCAVLTTTYRRLCDYELFQSPTLTKSVLTIDKKLRKLVLEKLCHEYARISRQRYIREALVLSPTGLFAEVGVSEDLNFLQGLLDQNKSAGETGSEAAAGSEARGELSSSEDDAHF